MVKPTISDTIPIPDSKANDLRNFLVLAALSLVWGSSFILIKKSLIVFSPTQVATLRIGISALAFLPVFIYQFRKVDWSRLKYFLVVGLFGSGLPAFFFAIAQTEISSSVTGILNSLTPLFTLFIGILFFKSQFAWAKMLGVFLGLMGAISLILLNAGSSEVGNLWYALLVVFATACYGTSVNTVGTYLRDLSSVTISSVSFSLFGLPALVYLLTTDFIPVMRQGAASWEALGYVSILALIGTVLASILFFKLVQWTNPLFSSTVTYLIPIVALGWGILDGEMVGFGHLIGMGLILAGIYLSRK